MSKLLEVGDVLYTEKWGNISREVIVRVTKTTAISKRNIKYKRECGDKSAKIIGADKYWLYTSFIETESLKYRYNQQEIKKFVNNYPYRELTREQEVQVYNLLKSFDTKK